MISEQVLLVKELGEKIGYGHMMSLASALWRKDMKKRGCPVSGVFIPTCPSFVREGYVFKETLEMYDKIVK